MAQVHKGYLITGFLGSGKTTLGIQLAAHTLQRGLPVAYVVNDIGDINIDYERIVRAIPGIDAADLSSVCIGCNGQEEFYGLLDEYYKKGVTLFVEPTGIFTGSEIEQLQRDVCQQWSLKVITLINTYQFLKETSAIALAKESVSQLAVADVVGLTWWHLLPGFTGIDDEQFIPVHQLVGAYTEAPLCLIPELMSEAHLETLMSIARRDQRDPLASSRPHHQHDHHHAESWHTKSIALRSDAKLSDLIQALAPVIEKIIRAKGDIGYESFDCVGGRWNTQPLTKEGTRLAVVISTEPLPEGILDSVSEGSREPSKPTTADLEKAAAYLFKNTAPLSPGGKLLPIDGQTYAAYGIAMKLPDGHELRMRAIHTVIERLIEVCAILRTGDDQLSSTHRTAGAYLPFFALTHWKELPEEMQRNIIASRPVELLVKGLLPLTEIGPGTGITGGTVRPSSLKNGAYRFATLHEFDSVGPLIAAFQHCQIVAIEEVKQEWEDMLNELGF